MRFAAAIALLVCAISAGRLDAQLEFEHPPISYQTAPTNDPISRLQKQLDSGQSKLEFDERHGYLPAVLKALAIPESSQSLVFSKTSFQLRRINPRTPRAIYFNDDSYIGWVQRGDVVEVSTVDPTQGAIFYTLSQEETESPRFIRDKGQCIVCHASSRTKGVPGHLIRSVYANRGGQPNYGSGTFTIDHTSPFSRRFGGWYVSGTHGDMRHMGNVQAADRLRPEALDREAGANVTDLKSIVNVEPYLQPTADMVALMVLEHQSQMHNLITLASYETRSSLHHDGIMNKALERPEDYRSDSTGRRIKAVGEKLIQYMLFSGEFELTSPVSGTSNFAKKFSLQGPRDKQGRSLRDFDLKRRMFRYPCSYLIYSESFDALPALVKSYVVKRLAEVLSGKDQSEPFSHLSMDDRRNILAILSQTKPELFASDTESNAAASE